MAQRKIRIGAAALGRAFSLMLPTLALDDRVELVAGADPRAEGRAQFEKDFGGATYESVEVMCAEADIDAVYVSSPHQFHMANTLAAAKAGKHILCEKPMALSVAECLTMIEAADKAGVHLMVGHSHSFDGPVQQARAMIEAGTYGDIRMLHALDYTDFLFRPRRPEELDTEKGGGIIYNQVPHQVDNIRFLGGGMVASVRALTGAWDAARRTEGACSALLTFENGAFANMTYSGYAHFDSNEFVDWIAESGMPADPENYGAARRALAGKSMDAEIALKAENNYGGPRYRGFDPKAGNPDIDPRTGKATGGRYHQNFGLMIASCDRADLRPTSKGVAIYADGGRHFEPLATRPVPRMEVIDELVAAVVHNRRPRHDGRWGLATMEVCFAILESARSGREIALKHQIPTPSVLSAENA
ncbi:MAG: Gfo/Idh/MocA family protein [Beijerinckiaceae bacterium]